MNESGATSPSTGYWLVTKGTWYVKVEQIDSTGNHGERLSPVDKIHIT